MKTNIKIKSKRILLSNRARFTPTSPIRKLAKYANQAKEKGVKVYGTFETKRKWYATPTNKSGKDNFDHPTVKPLFIVENLIENSSLEGETVLDFTCGSGSCGVACINTNRNFIGIELDKGYFDIAEKRINEAQNI